MAGPEPIDQLREITAANRELLETTRRLLDLVGQTENPVVREGLQQAVARLLDINAKINEGLGGVVRGALR